MSTQRPPVDEADVPVCPRCGTPHAPGQEYCLECGFRLRSEGGFIGGLAAAWRSRFGWYPGDWIWPAVLGLLIAIAGATAAIVVAADSRGGNGRTIVATEGPSPQTPTPPAGTSTGTVPTAPEETQTSPGPPQTPTTPPPAATTPPAAGALTTWPAGRSGYTVVLESIPKRAGRSLALSRARAAARDGLPQVGVLDSGLYSSLHPGYYVVFSGVFSSPSDAEQARSAAVAKGFSAAYSRQITQ